MAIRPIDLQTMFMRMTELSKEQSQAKSAAEHKQSLEEENLTRDSLDKESRVGQTEEVPEGPDRLDDRKKDPQNRRPKSALPPASNTEVPDGETPEADTEIRDPLLGNNIDISG